MATALRVTAAGALTAGAYLGVGEFGLRTAALLASADPAGRLVSASDLEDAFESEPSVVVAAFWRPSPALCERLDEMSFRSGLPWLPIILEHPVIRVGPLVVPPSGVCFRCYRRRCEQHDVQYRATAEMHAAYDADPTLGPQGFLPQHSRIAASAASTVLRSAAADPAAGDQVATLGLFGHTTGLNRVVPFGDCERCSTGEQPEDTLRPVLEHLRSLLPTASGRAR